MLQPGRRTIVLPPSQLYLQIHESAGHPTELDRVFGTEAAYAGTSFLTTDKLEAGFRYGSPLVDIVADARDSALVVPKDALLDRGTNRIAFVVEKGIAFERKLETGLSNRFEIEIISGLEENDRLVVEGFETLRNRAKVKVEK